MQEARRVYLRYEVSGMHTCDDSAGTVDDIYIDVIENIPQKAHNLLGHIEIIRVPSDLRSINMGRAEAGYGMTNAMMAETIAQAHVIAQELGLAHPDINQPYVQALQENDMYVIKFFQITKHRRGKGHGSYVLSKLPEALRRITNDQHPVIAVVPYAQQKPEDNERVVKFFEKNGYKRVDTCAQTLYYC